MVLLNSGTAGTSSAGKYSRETMGPPRSGSRALRKLRRIVRVLAEDALEDQIAARVEEAADHAGE